MSYSWRTDETTVDEEHYITTPQEDVVLAFTTTALLSGGDNPSSVVSRMYSTPTQLFTLLDDPTVVGATISQRLRGLAAGTHYLLRITFETGGNTRSMSLLVFCNV